MSEWFETWFESDFYLKSYAHRDEQEALQAVQMILSRIAVKEKDVLDVACGAGRHALVFAGYGFDVTANDLSKHLLGLAMQQAEKKNLSKRIVFSNQDMRIMTFPRSFGLAVQLFTSFGYFEDPRDDLHVIERVSRCLVADGSYVLDLFNDKKVVKELPRQGSRMIDGVRISEDVAEDGVFVVKKIDIDGRGVFIERVRKYSIETMTSLLYHAGFNVKEVLGDYSGAVYNERSPRMIFFARKK